MNLNWIDLLWTHTWWSLSRDGELPFSMPYHVFNLVEGAVWFACSGYVLWRWSRKRQSPVEIAYALLFLTFGLTDFREAWYQQSWLIWIKAINLGLLVWLRYFVIFKYYPEARLI